jgi:hypothetical protein
MEDSSSGPGPASYLSEHSRNASDQGDQEPQHGRTTRSCQRAQAGVGMGIREKLIIGKGADTIGKSR